MKIRDTEIRVVKADITEIDAEAIVNAANNRLVMGGGLAKAIGKKGGRLIEQEALKKSPIKIGQAIVTGAGNLKAKYVIHAATMGMNFQTDEKKIRDATKNSLERAEELRLGSIALPALGCGVGGFHYGAAAKIMSQEILSHLRKRESSFKQIIFVLYEEEAFKAFNNVVFSYLKYIQNKIQQGPFLTVDIIIEINKGIALIQRRNPPFGWALPGGFLDYGESLEEGARREAKEETGLDLENLRQFHTYSSPARDPRFHTVSTVYIAKGKGRPKPASDAAGLKVFKLNALPEEFAFDHKKILQDYIRLKRQ